MSRHHASLLVRDQKTNSHKKVSVLTTRFSAYYFFLEENFQPIIGKIPTSASHMRFIVEDTFGK